ncbi:MAG: potassium channel family protein [Balneolaceae bacterium]
MEYILLFTGIILVIVAYTDILQTTIQHTGAGFLSQRSGAFIWWIFLKLSGNNGKKSFLGLAGLFIVSVLILTWIGFIWLGFTLIFNFQPHSVLLTSSRLPTDFMDKLYYTGYTLSTLGNGDLLASNNLWRILTIILAVSGLLIITLSITYLIPLLSAVTNKRKLCAYISFLGNSPEEIILKGWNGNDFSQLNQHLYELSWMVLDHKEKHLLYPVLHYFHSNEKKFAAPVALTVLDETISVIKGSSFLQERIDMITLNILRNSLDDYLSILKETYIQKSGTAPYLPKLNTLYATFDIDRVQIQKYFDTLTERRELINGMVQADGWDWPIAGEV